MPQETAVRSKGILRALLDPRDPHPAPWSSTDLRAILVHFLATPVSSEIDQLCAAAASPAETAEILRVYGGETFGDMLLDGRASASGLKTLKRYAKRSLLDGGNLPRDVARVLYIIAIFRGRQAGMADITSLDATNLAREARRCLAFGWLPERVQAFLRDRVKDLA